MKPYLIFLVLALIIPISQAYPMSEISVVPSGSLAPGTSVTASFQIEIIPTGLSTFPEGNTLQFITDLDNASWTWLIFINGVGNPHPITRGRVLQLTSWDLTYRENIGRESVRVLLEGDAPQVTATQNKIVFDIMELDSDYNIISKSETKRESLVVNTADISNGAESLSTSAEKLKTDIDVKRALGADTSKAEEKYQQILKEIIAAKNFPPSGYLTAMKHLTDAQALIPAGMKDTNEAWALKMVADAQIPLDATNQLIEYIQANESTKEDPRLTAIISDRNSINQLLQIAKGEISNGNYDQARVIAIKGREQGNKTYQAAYNLKNSVDETAFVTRIILVAGILLVIIASIVLISNYRKKCKQKKEEPK